MPPTATAESETALQTPLAADVFVSRRDDLRLVKKPAQDRHNAAGERIERIDGEVLRFRDGRLEVPHSGTMTLEDGRKIKAADARKFLAEHPMFGDILEGFWPLPTVAPAASAQELEELVKLAQDGDANALRAFIATEESGFGREDVLTVARIALRRLETDGEQAE